MLLKDRQTLWGVSISYLMSCGKKYRLGTLTMYIVDIVLVVGTTMFLYNNNYSYSAYGYIVVCTALLFNLVMWQYLNPAKWVALKFYRKHKSLKVEEQTYSVGSEKLHSVLYCTGFRRMVHGGSVERYKEMILSACMDNPKRASSIIKYLEPYKDDNGDFVCYVAGGKYFVDLKEDEDGSNSNGSDIAGDSEDDDSRSDDQWRGDGEGLQSEDDQTE